MAACHAKLSLAPTVRARGARSEGMERGRARGTLDGGECKVADRMRITVHGGKCGRLQIIQTLNQVQGDGEAPEEKFS